MGEGAAQARGGSEQRAMSTPGKNPHFLGLRTVLYHAPDLARAKSWYSVLALANLQVCLRIKGRGLPFPCSSGPSYRFEAW